MYELPEFKASQIKKNMAALAKNRVFLGVISLVVGLCLLAALAVFLGFQYFPAQTKAFLQEIKWPQLQTSTSQQSNASLYQPAFAYEQAVINAAKNASPAVVSIVISKNEPTYEQEFVNPFGDNSPFGSLQVPEQVPNGTQLQEIGAGSGFFVSSDGLILTNKHVASDSTAQYTVYTNDGTKYQAKVVAVDPVQDLALIKIQNANGQTFPTVPLGNSDGIQIGQTAIAIGNALGQFSNSVSVGVISGLGRSISASEEGSDFSENLDGIIQTDAAINAGNSGGPLLNLDGQVIGIDTAMAEGAQSIGFAIPINIAKRDIQQVSTTNTITYAFLGVRYLQVDDDVQSQYNLPVDYGAYVQSDGTDPAVEANSPAAKAGLKSGDIILELNGEKISDSDSLSDIIAKYNPGDTVTLQVMRSGKTMDVSVTLSTRPASAQ